MFFLPFHGDVGFSCVTSWHVGLMPRPVQALWDRAAEEHGNYMGRDNMGAACGAHFLPPSGGLGASLLGDPHPFPLHSGSLRPSDISVSFPPSDAAGEACQTGATGQREDTPFRQGEDKVSRAWWWPPPAHPAAASPPRPCLPLTGARFQCQRFLSSLSSWSGEQPRGEREGSGTGGQILATVSLRLLPSVCRGSS